MHPHILWSIHVFTISIITVINFTHCQLSMLRTKLLDKKVLRTIGKITELLRVALTRVASLCSKGLLLSRKTDVGLDCTSVTYKSFVQGLSNLTKIKSLLISTNRNNAIAHAEVPIANFIVQHKLLFSISNYITKRLTKDVSCLENC